MFKIMSNRVDITQAFTKHLAASDNDWSVSLPNVEFDPEDYDNYLKVDFIFGRKIQATLGTNGLNRTYGICQIGVFAKPGLGWVPALTKADAIEAIFKRGTDLTDDGVTVHITNVSTDATPKIDEKTGKFFTPVKIAWYADTTN